MAKLSWKDFNAKHRDPFGLGAAVSSGLPGATHFDKNKRKLPTPYGLFLEWSTASITGDWASCKLTGGFIVCVETQADAEIVMRKFGTLGGWKETPACAKTIQIGYRDSGYASLAKSLGYLPL